ncbi:uncharacterized protein BDV14DRAFT_176753 [Aspergillus stella-maris]|uniref:uncharacterized protein n=1 Tax=Aspergillus stella-maris TaxID=1810926 RepID=UPI003CCD7E6C
MESVPFSALSALSSRFFTNNFSPNNDPPSSLASLPNSLSCLVDPRRFLSSSWQTSNIIIIITLLSTSIIFS